jgi:exopolysaccharide biosynthesis WecB/TagA/CpsF family protein
MNAITALTRETANITVKHTQGLSFKKRLIHKSYAKHFNVFGVSINKIAFKAAVNWLYVETQQPQNQLTTCHFVNADCLNQAYKNYNYRKILNNSDRVFADGSGVRLACKMKQLELPENINGTDLFPALCDIASNNDLKIFLLGGKPGVAKTMQTNMSKIYPNVDFVGAMDGYFSQQENEHVISTINASNANILLVAMGAPQQEFWINQNRHKINTNVCMGVGGLFDYYSGNIPRAPIWMRKIGCEWVWRFMQEPRRLAKRYLIGNLLFIYRVWREFHKESKKRAFRNTLNPCLINRHSSKNIISNSVYQAANAFSVLYCQFEESLQQLLKRSVDIVASCSAIISLSPIILTSMLCISIESRGPIFFSQTRVGKNGKPFRLWKFRSMYIDAEKRKKVLMQENEMSGGVLFKMKEDPRITHVGRFIRKYSIDELPQLWNVLNGSMSLVGPRPALKDEVSQYDVNDRQRLTVKPGITCIWQVSGRSNIRFKQQVELDQLYISQRSFWTDLKLLISTIPAVITARGAY